MRTDKLAERLLVMIHSHSFAIQTCSVERLPHISVTVPYLQSVQNKQTAR